MLRQIISDILPKYKYWAFISYSRSDERAAKKLHRFIETFRLPVKLVKSHPLPTGELTPQRFHPCFLDKADIPAGESLPAELSRALASSRHLIVICSPFSARSVWVELEISEFKRIHGPTGALRTHAFIIDGSPVPTAQNCAFTPSLRLQNPQALNAMKDGEGWRIACLKLIAKMLELPPDEIIQRDQERRLRARLLWTAASAAIAISMGALALTAIMARSQARTALSKSQISLSSEYFRWGQQLVQNRDYHDGLPFLAAALRADPGNKDAGIFIQNIVTHENLARPLSPEVLPWTGSSTIVQACFDRSSETMAVVDETGTIWIWNYKAQGDPRLVILPENPRLEGITFAQDPTRLVGHGGGKVFLIDLADTNRIQILPVTEGSGRIFLSEFFDDDRIIAVAHSKGLEWFNSSTGARIGSFPTTFPHGFARSGDGRRIAFLHDESTDSTKRESAILVSDFKNHVQIEPAPDIITDLAFLDEEGSQLVSLGYTRPAISSMFSAVNTLNSEAPSFRHFLQLWDTRSGERVDSPFTTPDWTRPLQIGIGATFEKTFSTLNHEYTGSSLASSPDGAVLLTAWKNSCQGILPLNSRGWLTLAWGDDPPDNISEASFDRYGSRLMLRSGDQVRLWSANNWQCAHQGFRMTEVDEGVVFSPDLNLAVTIGSGRVWDLQNTRSVPLYLSKPDFSNVIANCRNLVFRSGTASTISDPQLDLEFANWDCLTGKLSNEQWAGASLLEMEKKDPEIANHIASQRGPSAIANEVLRPGALIAANSDREIGLFLKADEISIRRLGSFVPIVDSPAPRGTKMATFSPDGKMVALAWSDDTVTIYKTADLSISLTLDEPLPKHEIFGNEIDALEFSSDGRLLLVGASSRAAAWNLEEKRIAFSTNPTNTSGIASSEDFVPPIFACGGEAMLQPGVNFAFADFADGKTVEFQSIGGTLVCMKVSSDGELVALGNDTGTVLVHEVRSGLRVAGPFATRGSVNDLLFLDGNQSIATLSGEAGSVDYWSVERGGWLGSLGSYPRTNRLAADPENRLLAVWGARLLDESAVRLIRLPFGQFPDSDALLIAERAEKAAGRVLTSDGKATDIPIDEFSSLASDDLLGVYDPSPPIQEFVSWSMADINTRPVAPGMKLGFDEWLKMADLQAKGASDGSSGSLIEDLIAAFPTRPNILAHMIPVWMAAEGSSPAGTIAAKRGNHLLSLFRKEKDRLSDASVEALDFAEYIRSRKNPEPARSALESETTKVSPPSGPERESESNSPTLTPPLESFPTPPGWKQFSNTKDALPEDMKPKFVGFTFNYPEKFEVIPDDANFIKIEESITDPVQGSFTVENFAVGNMFANPETIPGMDQEVVYPMLLEQFNARLEENFPNYKKVGEAPEEVAGLQGRALLFEAEFEGTEKGDIIFYGKALLLRQKGKERGIAIIMMATSLDPDVKSAEDVGVKGDLGEILRSFRITGE